MKTKSLLLATALLMSTSALAQKNVRGGVHNKQLQEINKP